MNKKALLITAGSVVVLAILGYLFLVPHFQVNAYANTIGEKQTKTNEALNKVRAILDRDTFLKTDVEHATVVSDVKVGNEAIANAESALQNSKSSLTTFNTLPLLSVVSSRYKAAESLKVDEQSYVTKYETFLNDVKSVLAYMDKSSDISSKLIDFTTIANEAMAAESPEDYSSKINKAIQTIQPAVDDLAKITPPASLKDTHDYDLKMVREVLDLYKQSATAMTNGDVELFSDILNQIVAKGDEATKKDDEFKTAFIRSSELQKNYTALFEINQQITKKQAEI
jgi:hypothetical protein